MAAAFALAIIRGNNIFIFVSPKRLRSFRRYFFQGKSCNGNRHRSTQFIAQATFKSAKHKKSFSVATWIFCMEPNCFGVTRGEQPLVRASRASKVAGAFLVLFWHAKENIPGGDAFCKRHQTLNTRPRFAREALRHFPTQKRSNTCSITASEAFSPVRSHRAASASSTQTETASSPKPPAAASSAPATASRARSAAES